MMAIGASGINSRVRTDTFPLIDTHTHFDAPVFDEDRDEQAQFAYDKGVRLFATDSKADLQNIAEQAPGSKIISGKSSP